MSWSSEASVSLCKARDVSPTALSDGHRDRRSSSAMTILPGKRAVQLPGVTWRTSMLSTSRRDAMREP